MEVVQQSPTTEGPREWFTGDVSIDDEPETEWGDHVSDVEYLNQPGPPPPTQENP